jgi:hypothetical protein
MERYAEVLTSEEQHHVQSCVRCQSELALFAELNRDYASADEQKEVEWVATQLRSRSAMPGNVRQIQSRRPRHYALAAAAVLAVVVGAGYWAHDRQPNVLRPVDDQQYRSTMIEGLYPAGDLKAAPTTLRWEPLANASSYAVRIMEVDQRVLWQAETVRPQVTLPAELVAQFVPGKSLLWDVKARRGNNVVATSGTQRFRVAVK